MYLGLDADLLALRDEVRSSFAELVTPELRAEVDEAPGPLAAAAIRRMGSDGWLGFGWPESLGGRGRTSVEQQVVVDEAQAAGAPWPVLTVATVAPTILHLGTPEQRSTVVPGILAGEIRFAIDEGDGTAAFPVGDAVMVRPQAVRDGDEWIVSGATTSVSADASADKIWLACRTAADTTGADGVSVLIVDADARGVAAIEDGSPGSGRVHGFRYDDVRVPLDRVVGEVDGGAIVTARRAAHERAAMAHAGWMVRVYRDVVEWASRTTRADGRRVLDQEWVQISLARVEVGLECLTLLNRKVATNPTHDSSSSSSAASSASSAASASAVDVATAKVFGTELFVEAIELLMEIVGPEAALVDAPTTAMRGRLESAYRVAIRRTRAGGANDAQRDVIAASGLGLLVTGAG